MEVDSSNSSSEQVHVVLDAQDVVLIGRLISRGLVSTSMGRAETAATEILQEQFVELESITGPPNPKPASERSKTRIKNFFTSSKEQRSRNDLVDDRGGTDHTDLSPRERSRRSVENLIKIRKIMQRP
jgi:hypothetical protein